MGGHVERTAEELKAIVSFLMMEMLSAMAVCFLIGGEGAI